MLSMVMRREASAVQEPRGEMAHHPKCPR